MYLCERCAILVASKGFEISKMSAGHQMKQEQSMGDFKSSMSSTFNAIKNNKNGTL